ncbi:MULTISPECIES: hypothetical protein, partial [Klebsiella]|uniref:hypothetical protein n=1 Tax=Klebsiella TaxID=570 RepID=UPI0021D886E9
KGWDARKRAYCLKIQPATRSFARNLIYSTKPLVYLKAEDTGTRKACKTAEGDKKGKMLTQRSHSVIPALKDEDIRGFR